MLKHLKYYCSVALSHFLFTKKSFLFLPDPDKTGSTSPPMVSLDTNVSLSNEINSCQKSLFMRFPSPPATSPLASGPGVAPTWYARPEMIPFLSLCSRYPGPWAGLLQQSMKEKQKMVSRKFKLKLQHIQIDILQPSIQCLFVLYFSTLRLQNKVKIMKTSKKYQQDIFLVSILATNQ
jgi:hypothetical protein